MNERNTRSVVLSRDFLCCFSSYFFLWISFDLFLLFPLYILARGGNAIDVGLQMAIFYFPSIVTRPLAGRLIDRVGRLKVIWLGALIMFATALALVWLKGNYQHIKYPMAAILFVRGIGYGAFFAAFFTYAADLAQPENRARIIGLFGVSGLVASGLAPRIGEIVIAHYHFHGFFLAAAGLALLSLVIALFLREKRPAAVPVHGVGVPVRDGDESGWTAFRTVTFSRKNLVILPGAVMFGWVLASFSTFGAPYFQEVNVPSIGNFFLVYGLSAGGVRIFLGGIADRYSRRLLVGSFFFVQAAGLAFLVVPPVSYFYLLAAFIAGGAHGILFPCMTAMAVDAHPEQNRGMITSVFSASIELGFTSGSYALGYVATWFGYPKMFVSVVVIAALFAAWVVVDKKASGRVDKTSETTDNI